MSKSKFLRVPRLSAVARTLPPTPRLRRGETARQGAGGKARHAEFVQKWRKNLGRSAYARICPLMPAYLQGAGAIAECRLRGIRPPLPAFAQLVRLCPPFFGGWRSGRIGVSAYRLEGRNAPLGTAFRRLSPLGGGGGKAPSSQAPSSRETSKLKLQGR